MGLPTQQILKIAKVNPKPSRLITLSRFYLQDVDGIDILQSDFESYFYKMPVTEIYKTKKWQRIDTISYEQYRSTDFWWMILLFNDWLDPINLPPTLKLFDRNMVKSLLALPGKYKVIETPYQLGQSII